MATGIFVNRNWVTQTLDIDLHDYDELTGEAVWRVTLEGEVRYVEANLTEKMWTVVDLAVHAYDEEDV